MAQVQATSVNSRPRSLDFPELKHKSEKMEAFENLQKNNVPSVLEDLLNKMCRVKPSDMYGYMVCTCGINQVTVVLSSFFVLCV